MKKICFIIMCLILVVPLSACTKVKESKESLIKYQSRLSKYTQSGIVPSSRKANVVDLSDGTHMRYDMKFAPKDPNFDVQLKDPYSY